MTDTQHTVEMDPVEQQRSVQGISQFFDIAGRESEVIADVMRGMYRLCAVEAVKHALVTFTPEEVRGAIAYRRAYRRTMRPGAASQSSGRPRGRPAGQLS